MNTVIGGDYKGQGMMLTMKGVPVITLAMGKTVKLDKDTVARYEVLDQQSRTGFSAGKAVAGAALFGGVGAIAGAGGKHKDTYTVAVYFRDGKKSLLELNGQYYKALISELFGVEDYTPGESTAVEEKQKKKSSGVRIAIIAVVIITVIAILCVLFGEVEDAPPSGASEPPASSAVQTEEPTPTNKPTMSYEEFQQIQTGMTYEQVVEIVGSEGSLMSESDIGVGDEYIMSIYTWIGEGSLGANANVTFQGGEVVSKAQYGLK